MYKVGGEELLDFYIMTILLSLNLDKQKVGGPGHFP